MKEFCTWSKKAAKYQYLWAKRSEIASRRPEFWIQKVKQITRIKRKHINNCLLFAHREVSKEDNNWSQTSFWMRNGFAWTVRTKWLVTGMIWGLSIVIFQDVNKVEARWCYEELYCCLVSPSWFLFTKIWTLMRTVLPWRPIFCQRQLIRLKNLNLGYFRKLVLQYIDQCTRINDLYRITFSILSGQQSTPT